MAELKLDLDDHLRLRQLGELLNYNGYGTRIEFTLSPPHCFKRCVIQRPTTGVWQLAEWRNARVAHRIETS